MIKIGVVIATYNSGVTLAQCLDSVLCQNLDGMEIYVQDGLSSDNTMDIVATKGIQNFASHRDTGVYNAWNLAVAALKKKNVEWIVFLGSDDYFESSKALEMLIPYLQKAQLEGINIVYGQNTLVDEDGQELAIVGDPWDSVKHSLKKRMTIRHPGCFHHISLFEKFGGFDESYKIIGDYHFIARALSDADALFYPFPVVAHRVGGLSNKPSLMLSVIKENFRLRRDLDLSPRYLLDLMFLKRFLLYVLSVLLGNASVHKLLKIYGRILGK